MADSKAEEYLEERLELAFLYDFYGALLKEKQQRIFEASVLEDYNFSEIAQDMGITRQGVHDGVKRACTNLHKYEEKLGLAKRFKHQKELVKKLHEELKGMGISRQDEKWKVVFEILNDILEEE